MKLFYHILLLSIFSFSCSQKTIVLTEGQLPEDVFYQKDALTPFSGICEIYYTNSEIIKEKMSFEDGVLDGCYTSYFKNGNIKRKGYYKDGFLDGTWIMFNEKRIKIYEVEYKSDTLSGIYRTWHPTGVPQAIGSYSENKKTGQWIYYNESGMITKREDL